jgi:hypothetical protein
VNEIREIIRECLKEIFEINEDFQYRYDGNFYPTEDVVSACKKALEVVEKNNLASETSNSNEGSGISRARSIVKKEPMTHAQLKRMKAFFDNNESEYQKEKSQGKTINDCGIIQSWELCGGDAGKRWCNSMIDKRHSSNDTSKTVRNTLPKTKTLMDPHNTRIHR